MRKIQLVFILLLATNILNAQLTPLKILTMEAKILVENDAFTLDLTKDQYYSSGIFGEWRYLLDSGKESKKIRSYSLNHRMYTPKYISWTNLDELDRPYAGLLSVTAANSYHFNNGRFLKVQLELGWLGPGALVGETQTTWHGWFGMPEPKGWQYQINNSPIVNLSVHHVKAFAQNKNIELFTESNLALGSVYNYVRQEVAIRIGELKPLHQSAYLSSYLGKTKFKTQKPIIEEIYFFYAPGLEYVFYNATIEGNLFGEGSIYTEDAISWVWQHKAGIMFSWPSFDLGITAYWRTQENKSATSHNYVGIQLNQRF
ncbi:MAG: lipid A 3-O-deacylase [Cyclobacteriaceae bacterium]|jgi:hypothetical protein